MLGEPEDEGEEDQAGRDDAGQGASAPSVVEDANSAATTSFDLAAARNALLQSAADSLQTEQKQLEKAFQASEQTCILLAGAPMPATFAEASLRQSYGETLEYRTRVAAGVLGIVWQPATRTEEKEEIDPTEAVDAEAAVTASTGTEAHVSTSKSASTGTEAHVNTPVEKAAKKVGGSQKITLKEVLQRQKDALRPLGGSECKNKPVVKPNETPKHSKCQRRPY
eukprot:4850811-Amphidinium_carterae.2